MTKSDDLAIVGPGKLTLQFFKLQNADWAMLTVLACIILVSTQMLHFIGTILSLGLAIVLMWPMSWSRLYYTIGENVYDLWIHFVLKDILWEAKTERRRRPSLNLLRFQDPFPIRVDWAHDVGMIWNKRTRSYSILIAGDGSDLSTLDHDQMLARLNNLASAIKRIATYRSGGAEVGFIVRRRPYNLGEMEQAFNNNILPDILYPASRPNLDLDSRSADEVMYEEYLLEGGKDEVRRRRLHSVQVSSLSIVEELGTDVDMVVVLTIQQSARLNSAAAGRKPLTMNETRREQIFQLAQEVMTALELMSVGNVRTVDRNGCEAFVRAGWDVVGLDEFRVARNAELDRGQAFTSLYRPQKAIRVTRDACKLNDTWIKTLRVTFLPEDVDPQELENMFTAASGRYISRSLVTQVSTGNGAYMRSTFGMRVLTDSLDGLNIRSGKKTDLRLAQMDASQDELAQQRYVGHVNLFLSAAHRDIDQVEDDIDDLARNIVAAGGTSQVVTGRSRVVRGAMSASLAIAFL